MARSAVETQQQVSGATLLDRTPTVFRFVSERYATSVVPPRVLSFGCSTGEEVFTLAEKYFPRSVVLGVDIDADSLEVAERRAVDLPPEVAGRVHFFHSKILRRQLIGDWSAIFAHSVLCRWPDTKGAENAGLIYPFEAFDAAVAQLVDLLSLGGLISIFNANYDPLESSSNVRLRKVECGQPPGSVHRFHRNGQRMSESEGRQVGVLFQRVV
jgi:SAM-dependent methyltransferase